MRSNNSPTQVSNRGQHPYRHKAQEIRYNNTSKPTANDVSRALDDLYSSGNAGTFRDNIVFTGNQGVVGGANTTFTLPSTPKANSARVFFNGLRLNPVSSFGSDIAYMISGAMITINQVITDPTWIILVDYRE